MHIDNPCIFAEERVPRAFISQCAKGRKQSKKERESERRKGEERKMKERNERKKEIDISSNVIRGKAVPNKLLGVNRL